MTRIGLLKLLIPALGIALAGCPSMPLNQSASTVAAGEMQQGFGIEYLGIAVDDTDGDPDTEDDGFVDFLEYPFPTYWVRYGITDNIDVGARYSAPFSVTLDAKFHLLDTDVLDLAIAPAIQYAFVPVYFHLPVLVGINVSDFFEVVLSPRFSFISIVGDNIDGSGDSVSYVSEPLVGGGLSFLFKFDNLQISPELHFLQGVGDGNTRMLSFNVGFAFTRSTEAVVIEAAPVAAPAAYVAPAPAPPAGGVTVEVQ